MDSKTIREVNELTEMAHELSSEERQLLFNLDEKGPGLLLELAVRTLHFPEEVSAPLTALRNRGLVQSDAFEGGQFGNELIYLSKRGDQTVALLREDAIHPHHHVDDGLESMSEPVPAQGGPKFSAAPDSRQQEVELLNKLGDLEAKSGNSNEARKYYQEALKIARGISSTSSSTTSVETSTPVHTMSEPPEPAPCSTEAIPTENALENLPYPKTEAEMEHNE